LFWVACFRGPGLVCRFVMRSPDRESMARDRRPILST
jgi:hypothetical protein